MSGSNYGGDDATIKTVINIDHDCNVCSEVIINHIRQIQGVQSVTPTKKQLTIVQELPHLKIGTNKNFSKPRKMTAVLGMNIDCDDCKKGMEKVIKSTPGYEDMSFNEETRLVEVKGTIAINTLAAELKKRTKKIVKIISMDIEGGDISSGFCLQMTTHEPLKSIKEILNRNIG